MSRREENRELAIDALNRAVDARDQAAMNDRLSQEQADFCLGVAIIDSLIAIAGLLAVAADAGESS